MKKTAIGHLEGIVHHMELVLRDDWRFTQDMITQCRFYENYIARGGSFLEPGVDDESNNWGNRGSFLATYRDAKKFLEQLQ